MSNFHILLLTGVGSFLGSAFLVGIKYLFDLNMKKKDFILANYYKERIEVVKNLYGLIVELVNTNNKLLTDNDKEWYHTDYRKKLTDWLSNYSELSIFYSKNKIFLQENDILVKNIRSNFVKISSYSNAIVSEYQHLKELEELYGGYLKEKYYQNPLNEIDEIDIRLIELKKNINASEVTTLFKETKSSLEEYFKNLVK